MSWCEYTNAAAPRQGEKFARFLKSATIPAARIEAEKIVRQISSGNTTAAAMLNSDAARFGRAIELLQPTSISLKLAAAHFAGAFRILGEDKLFEAAKFYTLLLACAGLIGFEYYATHRALVHDLTSFTDVLGFNSRAALRFQDQTAAQTHPCLDAGQAQHRQATCTHGRSERSSPAQNDFWHDFYWISIPTSCRELS